MAWAPAQRAEAQSRSQCRPTPSLQAAPAVWRRSDHPAAGRRRPPSLEASERRSGCGSPRPSEAGQAANLSLPGAQLLLRLLQWRQWLRGLWHSSVHKPNTAGPTPRPPSPLLLLITAQAWPEGVLAVLAAATAVMLKSAPAGAGAGAGAGSQAWDARFGARAAAGCCCRLQAGCLGSQHLRTLPVPLGLAPRILWCGNCSGSLGGLTLINCSCARWPAYCWLASSC